MPSQLEKILGMGHVPVNREDVISETLSEAQEQASHVEDDVPHYYRLTNVLERLEQRLARSINDFSDMVEEFGVYNTTDFTCTVAQSIQNPVTVKTILASYDPDITSWTLTLGRKVVTFKSSTTGLLFLNDCDFALRPGEVRSLNPTTGTPAVNTQFYIFGQMVKLI